MADEFSQYEVADTPPPDEFAQYEAGNDRGGHSYLPSPSAFKKYVADPLMEHARNFGAHPIMEADQIARNIVSGMAEGAQKMGDSSVNAIRHLLGKAPVSAVDYDKYFGVTHPYPLLKGGGENAPLGPLLEAGGAVGLASEGLPFIQRAARGAGIGAAYGSTQGHPGEGAIQGFIPTAWPIVKNTIAALPTLARAGRDVVNKPIGAYFGGGLSENELMRNLEYNQGLPTNLGNAINSPMLKKFYENYLGRSFLSGVDTQMGDVTRNIDNQGQGILSNLLGKSNPDEVSQSINDSLKKVAEWRRDVKNFHYDEFNQAANDTGVTPDLKNLAATAQKHKAALDDTVMLKYFPEERSLLAKLSGYTHPSETIESPILDSSGKPFTTTKNPTFKEANLLKGRLNFMANKLGVSRNPVEQHQAGIIRDLASSIKTDIRENLSEHPQVLEKYEAAENNYKNNYSQLLDKDIHKYVNGDADPDTIVNTFLKTGRNTDRVNLLNKFMANLTPEARKLVGHKYLSARALDKNNEFSSQKMATAVNALSHRQFKALFPEPSVRNALSRHAQLTRENATAFDRMANPNTGQRALDVLQTGTAFLHPALTVPALGINNLLARGLTSEGYRDKVVNWLLKEAREAKQ